MDERLTIICSAASSYYFGRPGAFDHRLAYVLGLQSLGHEVYWFEDVDPERCLDETYSPVSLEQWEGARHFERITKQYGIWPRCCLIYDQSPATVGMPLDEAVKVAKRSDLLLNVGGHLTTPEILESIACRAFLDIGATKTQVYRSEYKIDRGFSKHHHFFTQGLNIGNDDCEIPTCGLDWRHFFPPVHLDHWPARVSADQMRFTTVSTWARKGTFQLNGKYSGDKRDEWKRFIGLPLRTEHHMEVALDIDARYEEDIKLFRENGWTLYDARRLDSIAEYRSYIQHSRAEFSPVHGRYVNFNSGWFSDRSARYLASGKPVLIQSTGVEEHLPVGEGLLTFSTLDEAIAGIDAINSDYMSHCRAARQLAEEYLDSRVVMSQMLGGMGV